MINKLSFLFLSLCLLLIVSSQAATYKATDQQSYSRFLAMLQPGDTLLLANGVWNDFQIEFRGNGTEEAPIVLAAETPGKVLLSGKSSLKLAGSYLVVQELAFKNGYSPSDAVISFKISNSEYATHSRVTACVIDAFNKPVRFNEDNYVALWGRNNRVDHCYFAGKTNIGVTVEVHLAGKEHQESRHRIDHNYFGARPRLGSNGGETMRVGSSEVSKQSSFTLIEANYFERCNGETEVISIKSCDNIITLNTLFECEGGVVLRHGDRNIVSKNMFYGNGKPETGGIRVINDGHKVFDNYLSGLRGKDFRGPLVLMDGVPNSPLIRYHQVNNVEIAGNVWINCEMPWHFGYPFRFRGDEKVRVPPVNTILAWNVVYNDTKTPVISVYDDVSGIQFRNNFTNLPQDSLTKGKLITAPITLKNKDGMMMPVGVDMDVASMLKAFPYAAHGSDNSVLPVYNLGSDRASKNGTGPNWYSYKDQKKSIARTISVKPGKNTLAEAVSNSAPGDTIVFSEGAYTIDREVKIPHEIVFRATRGAASRPVIKGEENFSGNTLLRIIQGGSIKLDGLSIESSKNSKAIYGIASDRSNMSQAYKVFASNCSFTGFDSEGGTAIKGHKGTFADTVLINDCSIRNSYSGLSFNEETEDKGIYNAEYVILTNTVFDKIAKTAVDLYRGGTDESTFGPFLTVDHCVFNNTGTAKGDAILKLTGVQHVNIANSIFSNSLASTTVMLDGKYNTISNTNIFEAGKIEGLNGAIVESKTIYYLKPEFASDGSFLLSKNAKLLKQNDSIGLSRSLTK